MTTTADDIADWYLQERGITRHTMGVFGLRWNDTTGRVEMPYPNGTKERPDPTAPLREGQRRFYFTAGRAPDLFQPPVQADGETAFLCEGETDTMRLWQELGGSHPVYGIGGINTWNPALADQLRDYKRVHVLLDNDDDYAVRAQVDDAWRKIRHDLGGHARRVSLPGVKDVCEFFATGGDLETLDMMTKRMSASHYQPVDFSLPPPPVRWLLEGWIAMGDVTVLAGKGGLGKSMVTMDLALAVLNGWGQCLEQNVCEHGPVLYVDEENPLDVVYQRMLRFGLDPTNAGGLRFLWNQGIRLDRDPDTLLDEALEMKPALFVLDSLSRLHSAEENAAGEIGRILNDSIKPLARETGAGVVLIHHHDKGANGPRGSTDIVNAADAVIEVYDRGPLNPTQFLLKLTKSRRRERGAEITVEIVDTVKPDGSPGLALHVNPPLTNPIF